jgi:hypothetical protein
MPALPRSGITTDADFHEAIEACLQSVPTGDIESPEEQGITFIPNGRSLDLYATDRKTITRSKLPAMAGLTRRVVLSGEFCEAMQALDLPEGTDSKFYLMDNAAMYTAGDTVLHGLLVIPEQPLDFNDAVRRHLPRGFPNGMVDITEQLKIATTLAADIAETGGEDVASTIQCTNGFAKFTVSSNTSNVNDKVKLRGHPDVEVTLRATLVKRGLGRYDKILFTNNSAVLARGDSIYVVASRAS